MGGSMAWPKALVAAAFALASAGTLAQTMYRCTDDGRVVVSDKPCPGRPATVIGAAGPLPQRPTVSYTPSVSKANPYLQYMSPLCAELSEGLRNGPARGLQSRAMGELRDGYREKCSEDEGNARRRYMEDQRDKQDIRSREDRAEKAERDRQKLTHEQCDEMYRIVAGRRKKLDQMNDGERADFSRFETNWKARCS